MNTMRKILIAIQLQDDVQALFNDLDIVHNEAMTAMRLGRTDDVRLLSHRSSQICTQLTHLTYHLGQNTPSA